MDNNKSKTKLKGIPPIRYINLDGQPERAKYMEDQFAHWGIENFKRVSAHDGRDDDLSDILKGRYPDNMNSGEVGCVTSHLKLLKEWVEETDEPVLLVMEDDCDISTVGHWPFSWRDFQSQLPYDFDVVQLAIINPSSVSVRLHRRFVNDFSTASYLITRHHAKKLVNLHCRGNFYKLDQGVKPRAVADDLIYNSGNTYAIPIFLYKVQMGSSIHPEHVDAIHKASYNALTNWWMQSGVDVDIEKLMNYDPYLGRVTEPVQNKQ